MSPLLEQPFCNNCPQAKAGQAENSDKYNLSFAYDVSFYVYEISRKDGSYVAYEPRNLSIFYPEEEIVLLRGIARNTSYKGATLLAYECGLRYLEILGPIGSANSSTVTPTLECLPQAPGHSHTGESLSGHLMLALLSAAASGGGTSTARPAVQAIPVIAIMIGSILSYVLTSTRRKESVKKRLGIGNNRC